MATLKTFVVYEIWTKARTVQAETLDAALEQHEPDSTDLEGLSLCNWHAVEVIDAPGVTARGHNKRSGAAQCDARDPILNIRCELPVGHVARGEMHRISNGLEGHPMGW